MSKLVAINPQHLLPLQKLVTSYLTTPQVAKIKKAFIFADNAHIEQSRNSGEPYITHPVAVAVELAKLHQDYHTVIAGLLHDVVEDCNISINQISSHFGNTVAQIVDGVTKLDFSNQNAVPIQQEQKLNLQKMILAMSRDIRVIIVKLCDRLHNIRTLQYLEENKRLRVCNETLDIFLPIAKRLGIHMISKELEQKCFEFGKPNIYKNLIERIEERTQNWDLNLPNLEHRISKEIAKKGVKATISSRNKSSYSIFRKMKERKMQFCDISDIFALRIIVDDVWDCYKVLGIIHNSYPPRTNLFRDYIALPKENGYQSLHTVIHLGFHNVALKDCCAEVQIRTTAMDYISNYGTAAHASVYKAGLKKNDSNKQNWIQDLLEVSKSSQSFEEFKDHLKYDLQSQSVYVFSPKGDIYELPQEATALDFAFKVHTDLGLKAISCYVDGEVEALSVSLQSGQTVKIFTDSDCKPQPFWLNYVHTTKARIAINHYLETLSNEDAEKIGKNIIAQLLVNSSIILSNQQDYIEQILQKIESHYIEELHISCAADFYIVIGRGNLELLHKFQKATDLNFSNTVTNNVEQLLFIDSANHSAFHFAECCRPIPGDSLKCEYLNKKGIKIHRLQCKNFRMREERIKVQWSDSINGRFLCKLKIKSRMELGIFEKIARIASEMQIHIEGLTVVDRHSKVGIFELVIAVSDRYKLGRLIKAMRNMEEIESVKR